MSATDAPDWQRVVVATSGGAVTDAPDWQRVVTGPGAAPIGSKPTVEGGGVVSRSFSDLSPGGYEQVDAVTLSAGTTALVWVIVPFSVQVNETVSVYLSYDLSGPGTILNTNSAHAASNYITLNSSSLLQSVHGVIMVTGYTAGSTNLNVYLNNSSVSGGNAAPFANGDAGGSPYIEHYALFI